MRSTTRSSASAILLALVASAAFLATAQAAVGLYKLNSVDLCYLFTLLTHLFNTVTPLTHTTKDVAFL